MRLRDNEKEFSSKNLGNGGKYDKCMSTCKNNGYETDEIRPPV